MGRLAEDNNPAARLLHFIRMAKHSKVGSESVITVWARVFSIDGKDAFEVFTRLSHLWLLIEETETLIRKISDLDHEQYLSDMYSIRKGLSQLNFEAPWESVNQHFSDTAVTKLMFCAERIAKSFPEEVIPEETLREIQKDISTLFDKIMASTLRDEFKELLLDLLERMRRGISEYRIRGASALREALEGSIGRLVTRRQNAIETPPSEEEKIFFKEAKGILAKVGSAIDKAIKVKLLVDYGTGVLGKIF